MIKEIALADLDTMQAAIAAGVDRVELNDRLDLGGLTPNLAVVEQAVALAAEFDVELVVMVRPRGGDFNYTRGEITTMHQTLLDLRRLGVKQVTFGVVNEKHQIAKGRMIRLLEAAQPMQVVFHMAFDDIDPALQAITLAWLDRQGVHRVLTHGGPLDLPITETLAHLHEIRQFAPADMTVLPGGGVNFANAEKIADALQVNEVHGSKIVPLSTVDA